MKTHDIADENMTPGVRRYSRRRQQQPGGESSSKVVGGGGCDFSLLMSNRGALTWDVARRLTGCPQQSVSRLCPKSAVVSASCGTRSFEQVHVVELVG
jgi:hypothetical protein